VSPKECFALKTPCPPLDYSLVTNVLGLSYLAERRHTVVIRFIESLLDGKVESSTILSLIFFKVSQSSTGSIAPFYVPHATTNHFANEPLKR